MTDHRIAEPPSQIRVIVTLLGVALLAAFNTILLDALRNAFPRQLQSSWGWNAVTDLWTNVIFMIEALLLCACTWRTSGLGIGDVRKWKRHGISAVFVWLMPPLIVLIFYPIFTYKPFHEFHWPVGWWLIGSIAQELLFTGFIYSRMVSIFGTPGEGFGGALSAPMLITAFFYALSHWPNMQNTEHGMSIPFVQFQFFYAFLGCAWMLNIRRWTNCVWPGVVCHVLVNWLATVV